MVKYVPQRHWRTVKLLEDDIEHFERKSKTKVITNEEKEYLEEIKLGLINYNKWLEERTFCSKCDRVIDDGKQKYPDLCCECEK